MENLEKNTILTRITLKTSDRSVARRMALTLDMEFEMVAVKYPTQVASANPKMIAAVYKEALEYKRDQIINIHKYPPYDTELHRRYNSAYGKIFSIMSKTAALPSIEDIRDLSAACPEMDENEIILLEEIINYHSMPTSSHTLKCENISDSSIAKRPLGRPIIAPRFIKNMMENADVPDSQANRSIITATIARAYHQACLDDNLNMQELFEHDIKTPEHHASPNISNNMTDEKKSDADKPTSVKAEIQDLNSIEGHVSNINQLNPSQNDIPSSNIINLRMSELCDLAIEENKRTNSWQDSACRNAKVITEIFITENGDLLLSEINRNHLINVNKRILKMPRVWGKSKADKDGGMKFIFKRGEELESKWKTEPQKALKENLPRVGFSPTTHNRHINTLKQLLNFARNKEDSNGNKTHVHANVSFNNLNLKDNRKKNKLTPVPNEEEIQKLISGPIYNGCLNKEKRFTPGDKFFHDCFYWAPLLLIIYGNRSNELLQMPIENIFEDHKIPHFHIRASDTQSIKTKYSERSLPIAPKLIELGFLEYIKQQRKIGSRWLFPELNRTKLKASKKFMTLVFRPLLAYHFPYGTSAKYANKDIDTRSLRKFATTYLRKNAPEIQDGIRQAFFGHAQTNTISRVYEDDPSLTELLPCVIKLQELIASVKRSYPKNE